MSAENSTPESAKAQRTAKQIGIRWLKIYGVFYVILLVLYLVHCFTGSEEVKIENITPGRFIWGPMMYHVGGEAVELDAGTRLSARMVSQYRAYVASLPKSAEKPETIRVFKERALRGFAELLDIWNFVGLILLLYTALGDLIPKALDGYSEKLKSDLDTARAAKQESENLKARRDEMIGRVDEERKKLKVRAEEDSDHYYKRIIHQTHEDIARMREALTRHLEAQATAAALGLRARTVSDAVDTARERLAEKSGSDLHHAKVADFINQLKGERLEC